MTLIASMRHVSSVEGNSADIGRFRTRQTPQEFLGHKGGHSGFRKSGGVSITSSYNSQLMLFQGSR